MKNRLNRLKEKIIRFRDERDWSQFHSPKNLSQALGIEAAELQEIFLWKTSDASRNPSEKERLGIREEVADIFIYLIYLCHALDIDLYAAVEDKIDANGKKYPIEKSKGSNKKYTEFQG